jgi:hypothetical protein
MVKTLIIILILIFNLTFGQEKSDPTESLIAEFKSELGQQGISDFFVLKLITYGADYIFDLNDPNSCNTNGIYFTMYAFWKNGNDSFVKKFDNCGGFNSLKLSNSKPTEFYHMNIEKLKSDKINPYQTSNQGIANELVNKSISTSTHQSHREFWFFQQSKEFKNHFDIYNLTTEKENPNLNYKSNNELSIVKLDAICEKIIDEFNGRELFKRIK